MGYDSFGHIFAPVSTGDVASVLGVQSDNVSDLCLSEKINQYSLIRPVLTDDRPDIQVSQMKDLQTGKLKDVEGNCHWERRKWGYQVPYVVAVDYFEEILYVPWYRAMPTKECYKSLNHFDGYKHDASPMFLFSVDEHPQENDQIVIMFGFGGPQNDVVSPNGNNNNGGVVSAQEVFGETFYMGAIVKYGNNWRVTYGDAINPTEVNAGVLHTGIYVQANREYTIIPFITNMEVDGNVPRGIHYYNLNFAEGYSPIKTISVQSASTGISMRILEEATDGHITKLQIGLHNQYRYAFEMSNFYIELDEYEEGATTPFTHRRYAPDGGITYRVEGNSNAYYEWDVNIRWESPRSAYAAITGYGTLVGAPGMAQNVQTNLVLMTRK